MLTNFTKVKELSENFRRQYGGMTQVLCRVSINVGKPGAWDLCAPALGDEMDVIRLMSL